MNNPGFFTNQIRPFFAGIDSLIYRLVGIILEVIFAISDLTVSADFAKIIYKRIYVLIAIFMMFKLTVSFIKYVISPDAITDKEQGAGKIIVRTVTMLAILVILPTIFFEKTINSKTMLQALQDGVLDALPQVILGRDESYIKNSKSAIKNSGASMARNMLSALFYNQFNSGEEIKDVTGGFTGKVNDKTGGEYTYYYTWPLTTVGGVMLVVILLGFAVDVSIRVFKLVILQVMAPIPVISYIDPKSSKDGAFNAWVKTFVSTYIEIFIKLTSIYILLLFMSRLFSSNGLFDQSEMSKYKGLTKGLIVCFLIIGLFKFAKEAPKFIKQAFGIKDSGGDGLFGGLAAIGAAAGLAGGALSGAAAGAVGGAASGQTKLGRFGGAIGGALSGAVRGGSQGFSGAKKGNALKGIGGALAAQGAVNQRKLAAAAAGSTMLGRLGARARQDFLGQTPADADETKLQGYNDLISDVGNFKGALESGADKTDEILGVGNYGAFNLKAFKGTLAAANAGDENALNKLTSLGPGGYGFKDLATANANVKSVEKAFQASYYEAVSKGKITDADAAAVMSAKSVVDRDLANMDLRTDDKNKNTRITQISFENGKINTGLIEGTAKEKSNAIKSDPKYSSNKANKAAISRK